MTRICFLGAIALCSVAASATVVKSSPDETKPRPVTGESACPATNERLQPASALPEGVKAKWQREDPGKYWDFSSLAKCPEFRKSPFPDSDWPGMQALLVNGKGPDGVNAEFFAYYAAPSNAASARGCPGVVLVHGGGGTAFPQYVERWVGEGFAVLAIDWYNQRPLPDRTKKRLVEANISRAPLPGGKRNDIVANVANMVLAHSLLRSFREVDADSTVFVGLSWGSWYGAIVAALDPRFKGVVEIYCGDVKRGWPASLINGRFLHAAKCPMWWVVGTNDRNVTPETSQAGFDECASHWGHAIVARLPHSHCGFDFDSPVRMARHFACGEKALPRLGKVKVDGGRASAAIVSRGKTTGTAYLAYTCDGDEKTEWKREWKSVPAEIAGECVSAVVPDGAIQAFFSLYEEDPGRFNDLCGSSDVFSCRGPCRP